VRGTMLALVSAAFVTIARTSIAIAAAMLAVADLACLLVVALVVVAIPVLAKALALTIALFAAFARGRGLCAGACSSFLWKSRRP